MNVVHENVLVEVSQPVREKGGVLIPEVDQEKEFSGKVIRFGESVPQEVKIMLNSKPDVIFKEFYDGGEVALEKGKTFIVMNFKDLLIIK